MTLLDRIAGRMGYSRQKAAPETPAFLSAAAEHERYRLPDYALADNQKKLYQALSWVHISVDHVSNGVATTPLSVRQRVGEETEGIPNHPFEDLLQQPNPHQSRFEYLKATAADIKLTGNSYTWLNLPRGEGSEPAELFVLPSERTKVIPGSQWGIISHYEWDAGLGDIIRLEPWEVVHFKNYHPRNMWTGLSPIEAIRYSAEKDLKAQEYDLNFYSKDNAKLDGALAFKGSVQSSIWEGMKADIKRRFSGNKRELLMLQGAEDISWINMGMTQADMRYIEGREFTKEEVYALFAPGLSSILSVNATEANSKTGKETFYELAVYPLNVLLAETITNSILPAYGDGLVAEFEDVRTVDKLVLLQEQEAAWKVLTVAEVRQEYYDLPPLGDERDNKLVDGVGVTPAALMPLNAPPAAEVTPAGAEPDNEVKAHIIDVTPQPTDDQLIVDELRTWERWIVKRMKAGKALDNVRQFETEHIPTTLTAAIMGALEAVETVQDARHIFADAVLWQGYP